MEAFLEARKTGKIRYIGFTGHKDPHVHLYMLTKAKQRGFRFDTVQMPLNVMDAHFRSFQTHVLPVLLKDKIGVLGMKSMGGGVFLKRKVVTPLECLHCALSLPTSVVITGIDSMRILEQAFEAMRTF
jgi:aryl-alcohol dehydrogenase-like predicted oxidoreductase